MSMQVVAAMPVNTEYAVWNASTNEEYFPDHSANLIIVGNTRDSINWQNVINSIEQKPGLMLPNLQWTNPHFLKILEMYNHIDYLKSSMQWINYYCDDYGEHVNTEFGNFVKKPNYVKAWISRINPGYTAPWHWDIDDNEAEYLKHGDIIRFSCRINMNSAGQVAIVGDHAIHGGPVGDVYQWPDHRMWHGSVNTGLEPKYQFNYLAYK